MIRVDDARLGAAAPGEVNVIVTQPAGSAAMALRVERTSGVLSIDRLYQTAMRAPGTFGLLPQTRGEDGEPLAAFVPIEDPLPPGLVLPCRPVGVVYVTGSDADVATVLCVPLGRVTARLDRVRSYTDVPAAELRRLSHFLTHCQDLEDDQVPRSAAWGDVSEAHRVIEEAARRVRPRMPLAD